MHIMIMGAGALGSYYGARLQAAGHAVTFVARGAQLEALQTRGLRIFSPLGDLELPEVRALADPAEAGPVDAVVLLVKSYDVESAGEALRSCLGTSGIVITGQNGVTAHRRLAAIIGADRVAPGMVYMPAEVTEPGVIRHGSDFSRLVLGPLMDGRTGPLDAVAEALDAAGITVERVVDPEPALWEKFALLAPMACLTCLTRLDLGPIRDCPETLGLLRAALDETMAVGQAVCPGLSPEAGERAWSIVTAMRREVHASMLDDLRRGKRLELEDVSGEIARLGAAHGIPTPVHAMAYSVLRPFRDGAPG